MFHWAAKRILFLAASDKRALVVFFAKRTGALLDRDKDKRPVCFTDTDTELMNTGGRR